MQKPIRFIVALLLFASGVTAQNSKHIPPSKSNIPPAPEKLTLNPAGRKSVPLAENPFGFSKPDYKPIPHFNGAPATPAAIRITRDASGAPVFYSGKLENAAKATDRTSAENAAMEYVAGLQPEGIANPVSEFMVKQVQTDEQGNYHVRIGQTWKNIPVYGSEVIAHSKNGIFEMLNGRFSASPALDNTTPSISSMQAIELVKADIGREKIKADWSPLELQAIGTEHPFEAELVIYQVDKQAHLAWHITAHPNMMRRVIYFADAQTGAILNKYDHTCAITHVGGEEVADGPVTANGTDLLGVNRTFSAWKIGSTNYLEDGSQSMFNSANSQMPGEPIGALLTLDAKNTSPDNSQTFDYDYIKSTSLTFSNTSAVSAHWNSLKSYQYYKDKFGRNSIDGNGGNIIAFINVADDDGSSMENAFWNGAAMWYGNGGSTFKKLARGLDVGGHEMTHGVVEKTANLEYQDESGALNESFADVFGAMIDPGDWQIGEDVMQSGGGLPAALRDLSNPHNGFSQGSSFWQPAHVNEQYSGNQDNGGVHINSGIPNKAYYLFATAAGVGTDKAEQVYYKALRDYLVKSSKFIDCRIAVIQAANDLYGSAVATAAGNAFTQVGILGNQPTGNYLGQLALNTGTPYIMCVTDDYSSVDLADAAGNVLGTVYDTDGIKSRPSISDNGATAVFVNETGHILLFDFTYGAQINFQVTQLSTNPEWRNAAISKDGRFLAATTDVKNNKIYIFDLLTNQSETFELFNPTYSEGQSTGDVQYADVMEFDYSGEFLMYDAFNKITNTQGQEIEYWDIGFVQFRENGAFADGTDAYISKLFSGLPENTDIGDPTFAKNSPFIIAFDYYDQLNDLNSIIGANIETGDYSTIISEVGDFGWPSYDREDKNIILHSPTGFSYDIYKQGVNSTKIQPQGSPSQLVDSHIWGVWYAIGNRSLSVDAGEVADPDAFRVSASPNPTSASLQVRFKMPESADVTAGVYQLTGAMVMERTMQAAAGDNFFDVDLGDQPVGVYFIRIQSGNGLSMVKVVKQ